MLIRVKNIKLFTLIGVHDWERTEQRPLNVSLLIDFDHTKAVETDSVEHTFDYALIESGIVADMATRQFQLLESAAEHVCRLMFGNELVREVTVEIEKPGIMRFAESVSVIHSMTRE